MYMYVPICAFECVYDCACLCVYFVCICTHNFTLLYFLWFFKCCGETPYGLAQRGVLCCNNTLYMDREDGEECSDINIPYNPTKGTMCCSQFHGSPGHHCCGTEVYRPHTEICCNGHRWLCFFNQLGVLQCLVWVLWAVCSACFPQARKEAAWEIVNFMSLGVREDSDKLRREWQGKILCSWFHTVSKTGRHSRSHTDQVPPLFFCSDNL